MDQKLLVSSQVFRRNSFLSLYSSFSIMDAMNMTHRNRDTYIIPGEQCHHQPNLDEDQLSQEQANVFTL